MAVVHTGQKIFFQIHMVEPGCVDLYPVLHENLVQHGAFGQPIDAYSSIILYFCPNIVYMFFDQRKRTLYIVYFYLVIIRTAPFQLLPADLFHQVSVLDDSIVGGNLAEFTQNMRADKESLPFFVQ